MPRFDPAQVRRYYDRHTPGFVAFGDGGRIGAIHRAVWGPGVVDRHAAFRFVEDQIAAVIQQRPIAAGAPRVADLGCGVGASLSYLAGRLPIRGVGITLSPVQARLAASLIAEAGVSDRIVCLEGDYCDLPPGLDQVDVAYAIESFVHGPDPARFLDQCRALVRPGGVLAICDDFLARPGGPAATGAVEEFREGWHINTLLQTEELIALAKTAGFAHTSTLDLSSWLEIHRLRDRLISVGLSLVGWCRPFRRDLDHLFGGRALQRCLARGWIRYQLVLFRRED